MVSIEPSSVAYICFTSGSTGPPKGVVITHANVAAVLENQGHLRIGPGDRVLQLHSIAFDAYVTNLLVPLLRGATAVRYDRDALVSAERFLAWCGEAGISHMGIPTSLFHTIVDEAAREGHSFPSSLKHIAIGGEQVRADAVETFYSIRHPELRLNNNYGPTETTVWVLTKNLSDPPERPYERVPIGSPPPNVWAYVLDQRGRPAPVGIAGELVIGGSQVGAGYFGDAKLTDERFIPDPFSGRSDALLYRTGDLARWLPTGEVEFLGRIDRQVNIRGFRVEPEAIESTLRRHPEVGDAVVVDAAVPGGSATLRAYVVPTGPAPLEAELRSWCRASLPEFMVPSSYTVLDEIPRTVSRKLDRSRLPEPGATEAPQDERSPVTAAVAEIWSESLGLQSIPAGGDFFDLGGHSLIAMRVIGRVRQIFEVDVPLSTLFDHPTVEAFADVVAEGASPDWQQNEMDALLAGLADLNPDEAAALLAAIDPDGDG
jgi:amino acid adenylation domain-containing protein